MVLVEDIGYRGLIRVGIFSYIAHGEQLLEVLREKNIVILFFLLCFSNAKQLDWSQRYLGKTLCS